MVEQCDGQGKFVLLKRFSSGDSPFPLFLEGFGHAFGALFGLFRDPSKEPRSNESRPLPYRHRPRFSRSYEHIRISNMAETQAPAQEQPTEGTTQSPPLPPLPDFLQRHSVRTVKQNGEDRTFVVLNHHPLSFQNQPKSRRKTPRNPVRSRSFKLKVRETHGLFIDSNSAPII